jgi:hypothetical protein
MRAWAVYETTRGRFTARRWDADGCHCLVGGKTEAESRERAKRIAALFNADVDEAKAQRAEQKIRRAMLRRNK